MFQRKYLIFLAVLILAAFAWTGGWFWLADKLRSDIANFVAAQHKNGIVLGWSDMTISGYPIRFDTTFEEPQGQWTNADTRILWTGANTSIRPFIEGPGIVSFDAPGQHQFRIQGNGADVLINTDTGTLEGRLAFDKSGQPFGLQGRAAPFTAGINGVPVIAIAETAFDWERRTSLSTGSEIHPDSVGETLSVILEQIDLTKLPIEAGVTDTLGQTIQTLTSRAALRGPLDPASVDAANLTRWRDAGGTLEVETFNLVWGPLRIAGNGTLTVDQALQPVGAFSARVSGLDKLLDVLEARGQIQRQQTALARIALAVLMRTPANGGPPEASLPITIQDRLLSIGPIPLTKLEPIAWK